MVNIKFSLKNIAPTASIFLLALAIRLLYLKTIGIHLGGDTIFYDINAKLLIANHFNPLNLIRANTPPYYWLYPYLLAMLQNNHLTIIICQIILQALAAVLIYKTAATLYNPTTGIIAGTFYAIFFEIFQWDSYILTDSIFMFLLILTCYLVTKLNTKSSTHILTALVLNIIAIAFLRPTSLPFFIALAAYTWRRHRKAVIATILILVLIGTIAAAKLNLLTAYGRFGVTGYLHYFSSLFERGIVVRDRPYYTLPVHWDPAFTFHNFLTFLNIFSHKLAAFWYVTYYGYSLNHKLLNIMFMIPLYCFGLLGYLHSRKDQSDKTAYKNIQVFLIATILTFWIFHSLTEVDYDSRYRLPVWPAIIIFASYGATQTFTKNKKPLQ